MAETATAEKQKNQFQNPKQDPKNQQLQRKGQQDDNKENDAGSDSGESEHPGPQEITQERQDKALNQVKQDHRPQQSNRSRSASRRARRQRIKDAMDSGARMKTSSLEALEEADADFELMSQQPFERIGPDSTSMDGPVTQARAQRGEIPLRGSDPNQPRYAEKPEGKQSALADQDGLKLTLEANLDVEIELKASIRGDLTLSLHE